MSRQLAYSCCAVLWLAACTTKCVIPVAGSCSVDSDCVLAFCGDTDCPACSAGSPIAKSQVGESPCLLQEGTSIPAVCGTHEACPCPCFPQGTAACVGGTCVRVVQDGGCG